MRSSIVRVQGTFLWLLFYSCISLSLAYGQMASIRPPEIAEELWTDVDPKDREIIETLIMGEAENKRRLENIHNLVLGGWEKWSQEPRGDNSSVRKVSTEKTFTVYRDGIKIRYDREMIKQFPPGRLREVPERHAFDGSSNLYVMTGSSAHVRPLNKYGMSANFGGIFEMISGHYLRDKDDLAWTAQDVLGTVQRQKQYEESKASVTASITKRDNQNIVVITQRAWKEDFNQEVVWEISPDQGCQIVKFSFVVVSNGKVARRVLSKRELQEVGTHDENNSLDSNKR